MICVLRGDKRGHWSLVTSWCVGREVSEHSLKDVAVYMYIDVSLLACFGFKLFSAYSADWALDVDPRITGVVI